MKVKFIEAEYELITRELQDARLCLTFMKGEKTCDEIQNEIRESEAIVILDEEAEIATYTGFTDVIVVKDFVTGAISVELINNFLLQRTMELAGRVATLEDTTSNINERTAELEQNDSDFSESQDNQDTIIADLLEMEG